MRVHRNLVLAVIEALESILLEDRQADKVLQYSLKKNKRWGSRDRAFVAETTYEIVRWKRWYGHLAQLKEPLRKSDIPGLVAAYLIQKLDQLPAWEEFHPYRNLNLRLNKEALELPRTITASIPDWLDQLGEEELGAEWDTELKALNQQAPVILRTNSLKTTRDKLQSALEAEGIRTETLDDLPLALQLEKRTNVFRTKAFKDGLFEVQDASSQMVAPFLDPKPGMRVIDACAGAGGKALHLASLMENKGQIVAMDIYDFKLKELKLRARRNGIFNVTTRLVEGSKSVKRLRNSADKVLIDAPCSGLGVLRRNPDAKWKLDSDFLDRIRKTQAEILDLYSGLVKPGGQLVYATCSILPSENQLQVQAFLKREQGKSFKLLEEKSISVVQTGFDGFYMALLENQV
ncbi:RsmB/NOP family class I SAM-dependent RNA methyltransferase [Aureitalea marina]|uniref:RNA methyltransferase n=1 Tax=Aureitalea marina TaxID=930804 RepID=A0A2S7KPP4_9FLAO|nr:methyltransferase domain-containing protein [Aureitalea marina]PQB04604.1 RNA methyltransferase [Aureitalea marina]